jgi:hypothetical protein
MQAFRWVALGVLIGFAGASAAGNLSLAVAAKQGPSASEAQASLAKQEAVVQQIAEQWEINRAGMAQTAKMQMGPSMQRAMMQNVQNMHEENRMMLEVMQSQIAVLKDLGAHNR